MRFQHVGLLTGRGDKLRVKRDPWAVLKDAKI